MKFTATGTRHRGFGVTGSSWWRGRQGVEGSYGDAFRVDGRLMGAQRRGRSALSRFTLLYLRSCERISDRDLKYRNKYFVT
jgi:hypothetical protein